MKTTKKYLNRYLYPVITLILGYVLVSLIDFKESIPTFLVAMGSMLLFGSLLYLIIITLLQFFVKNNNFLIPISLLISVNVLFFQYKIQHWTGQYSILIVGNSIAIIAFVFGINNYKKGLNKEIGTDVNKNEMN
jgi:hypothetical protein